MAKKRHMSFMDVSLRQSPNFLHSIGAQSCSVSKETIDLTKDALLQQFVQIILVGPKYPSGNF